METIQNWVISQVYTWGYNIGIAFIVFIIFWIAANIMKRAIIRITKRFDLNIHISSLLVRIFYITFIIVGVVTALGTVGIDVSALVAGLGLTGFALGFALKDTISNLLAGVLILLYKPFSIDDEIKIAGYHGIVKSIDLRYTELQNAGDKILIPNSKLFTDPITVLVKSVDSKIN
jgi:small-conductance mechanosensitive channel